MCVCVCVCACACACACARVSVCASVRAWVIRLYDSSMPFIHCAAVGQMKSYQQPYEEFVGSNPGIDDMRIVVVDKHCRPELPISFCRNPVSD